MEAFNQLTDLGSCWSEECDGEECPPGECSSEMGACFGVGTASCAELQACLYLCPDDEDGCGIGCIMGSTPQAYVSFDTYQDCVLDYCDDSGGSNPYCLIIGHLLCTEEAEACGYGVGQKLECPDLISCLETCFNGGPPMCFLTCLYESTPEHMADAGAYWECTTNECPNNGQTCIQVATASDGECGNESQACGY